MGSEEMCLRLLSEVKPLETLWCAGSRVGALQLILLPPHSETGKKKVFMNMSSKHPLLSTKNCLC